MFGIGTGELLLIFIIALVVFGPERLPGLARDVGKAMNELRKTSDELTQEFLRADTQTPAKSEPPALAPGEQTSTAAATREDAPAPEAQAEAEEPPAAGVMTPETAEKIKQLGPYRETERWG